MGLTMQRKTVPRVLETHSPTPPPEPLNEPHYGGIGFGEFMVEEECLSKVSYCIMAICKPIVSLPEFIALSSLL